MFYIIIPRLFFVSLFQIRAANLSGDCTFKNEAARFNFGLKQHHQVPAEINVTLPCRFQDCVSYPTLDGVFFPPSDRSVSEAVPFAPS